MAPGLLLLAGWSTTALLTAVGVIWAAWLLSALYLLTLALCAAFAHKAPQLPAVHLRNFCLLIPAHDEELLLADVLDKLRGLQYPERQRRVVVIADNCSDRTAEVARAHGAEVLERRAPDRRGKGYALEWAIRKLLAEENRAGERASGRAGEASPAFDAVVVLDADSELCEEFLHEMNAALEAGAEVVQGRYDVLNAKEAWRTRLMACALALAHYVKPLGRTHLGLSDGLKGNGMCFSRGVLERVPWSGASITEDIDYTLRLARAGVRIAFAPGAVVRAQMPTGGRQAASQRRRWEGGRYGLMRQAVSLLLVGLRQRHPALVDRALELLIPPLVELFTLPTLCVAGSVLWLAGSPHSDAARLAVWAWCIVLAVEALYLLIGLRVARVPWAVASSLLFAPAYAAWKLALYPGMVFGRGVRSWVRTERTGMNSKETTDHGPRTSDPGPSVVCGLSSDPGTSER